MWETKKVCCKMPDTKRRPQTRTNDRALKHCYRGYTEAHFRNKIIQNTPVSPKTLTAPCSVSCNSLSPFLKLAAVLP